MTRRLDFSAERMRTLSASNGTESVKAGFPKRKRPRSVAIKVVVFGEPGITARKACEAIRAAVKDSGLRIETGELKPKKGKRK